MKNRFNRLLSFLLIVATLCSFLSIFASAASEVDSSVKMFYSRKYNEGWDYTNGMTGGSGLSPFINHEYDDDYNYNYYLEVTEATEAASGGMLTMTIPSGYRPTTGKTVLSFSLKLPADSNQEYGTVVSAKTQPGAEYNFLSISKNQITSLGSLIGTVYNDEWIKFEYVMDWSESSRVCTLTVDGGGLSTSVVLPLEEGQRGISLQTVSFGMENRDPASTVRTYGVDNLVFYNTASRVVAEEDLSLYGVGSLVKETEAKTIEIYGETTLAPTDYIKKGLTMKVGVDYYMTDVLVDELRGTYKHTKQNIYETENGDAYGSPVKIDGVVYVPLDIILAHLGYEYKTRENSVEISTGGTTSVCITVGSTSASVNGQRVELAGAPGFASSVIDGEEYKYLVIPMDNVETFFAQASAPNPLYVTYDDMGLIFLCGKDNVWNRSDNLTDMAVLMEKFIFDYDYENKGKGFGEQLVKDMEEHTGFQHPYIYANQDRWDTLRAVWLCNDQAAYDKLMALSPVEKDALGISGADPEGYSETLRDWVRAKGTISRNDPDYIFANGEWIEEEGVKAPTGTNGTAAEMMYAAGSAWLILDEDGNYLGMNPGSTVIGKKSYRGSVVNTRLIENGGSYDDGYDAGGRFSLNTGSIQTWAWNYQITRDLRYAQIVFDHISILGDTDIWAHWGPTHFLNTADGTTDVAIAYDWLCPAWDALLEQKIARPTERTVVYRVVAPEATSVALYYMTEEEYEALGLPAPTENTVVVKRVNEETGEVSYEAKEIARTDSQIQSNIYNRLILEPPSFPGVVTYDRKHLATIIMNQGVHEGWLAEACDMTDHPSVRCLGGFEWKSNTDNWNAVCTKGMALGGMMTLEYEEFRTETNEMFDIMMYYFFVNGLDEYAPDGAYYESASYWSYGTNAVFALAMAYESAAGTDYGIMDGYGLDRTCYFAANVESSDAMLWTYNDAGSGETGTYNGVSQSIGPNKSGMETGYFMWVGRFIGDQGIIDHRVYQLENGLKNVSYFDIFNYKPSYAGVESIDLPLSYYMEGLKTYCGAYSVRSSWERGAMTCSMIGGTNAVAHADVDAGAFMYWNDGKAWIWDLGADNYNLTSFFGASYGSSGTLPNRFRYYLHGAEGNNVVVLASRQDVLPFGQRVKGVSPLQRQYSDEHGAFAIFEMLDIYSADPELAGSAAPLVGSAARGVMATDDYQTVVIQDEIIASKMETFYWFAHFSDYYIKTTISADGRTCYMTYKEPERDPVTNDPHYSVLRLTLVSPDRSDRFYITGAGDEDMVFDATFRYGTHQNYPDQLERPRDAVRRLCIKRELKTNFRVAVVFEMLPDAFYNPRTGVIDVEGGQDTYPCSYTWTDMYNWSTKAATDYDFEVEEQVKEEVLSVLDLSVYGNIAKGYANKGTAYTTDFYNLFDAISRVQRVWDKWGTSDMAKPFEASYQACEEYMRSYNRIQKQINQNGEIAVKISKSLAGMR